MHMVPVVGHANFGAREMNTRSTHALRLREGVLGGCLLVIASAGCSSTPSHSATPTAGGGGTVAPPLAGGGVGGGSALPAGSGGAAGMLIGGQAGVGARPAGTGGVVAGAGAVGGSMAPPVAGGTGGTAPVTEASVLQYHKDAKRSGMYTDAAFTRAAAAMLKKDTTFTAMVAGPMYAQPLYFEGGPGGKELLITATEQNEVTAFNAADGMVVWRKTLAPPVTAGLPCGNISPLGVTGTPVIDAASRTLFVAAMTAGPKHQIFALSLDDGATRMGWPVDVSTIKAGSLTFSSAEQNQRGALIIVNNTVYVPYGGHFGDCGNYHGWVVGVPIANPSAPIAFVTKAHAAGIWATGGLASDGTSVFAATGNSMADGGGNFSSPPTWGHGNAILRLAPDLKNIAESQTKDFFAAQNWASLDGGDLDVGGSGPILFDVPGATPSSLAMALGKGGVAYLVSVDNLGGMGGMLQMKMVAGGGVSGGMIQAAAAYTTPTGTFVAFRAVQTVQGCGTGSGYLGALKVEKGAPPTLSVAWCAGGSSTGSPIVTTTDGTAESVVWLIANGKVLGFNGETGAPIYTGGGTGDAVASVSKFQTPMVAKGRLFVAASNQLVAYTLK
jgi:hypothetical protein